MDLKRKIQKLARKNDIDLIGVSSVGRFKSAPSGKRPTDLLGEAKTVISLGIGIRSGVREANLVMEIDPSTGSLRSPN